MAQATLTHSPITIPQAAITGIWDAIFPHHRVSERSAVDWTPADAAWPLELRELHAAVCSARAAWRTVQNAVEAAPLDSILAQRSHLLMLAYIALEHEAAGRIEAYEREHPHQHPHQGAPVESAEREACA